MTARLKEIIERKNNDEKAIHRRQKLIRKSEARFVRVACKSEYTFPLFHTFSNRECFAQSIRNISNID